MGSRRSCTIRVDLIFSSRRARFHHNTLRTAHNPVTVLRDLAQHDQADTLQTWIGSSPTS